MKINNLNPSDFIANTLAANERTDFVLPVIASLNANTFIIIDQTHRQRFVTGDKFDLSFVSLVETDFSYLNNPVVEDVDLEEINVRETINNGNTVPMATPVYDPTHIEMNVLQQFGDLIGTELLTKDTLRLSRDDNQVTVELLTNPYFTGTFTLSV